MEMKRHIWLSVFFVAFVLTSYAQQVTITPPSANIEPGESVTLTASGALYYLWSPATGLSTTEGPVTVASPMVTTTYTCAGYAPGPESVVNGDFEQGNVGFTSAYQYNSNLWNESTYYVDYDASLHHTDFVGLGHGGTGNFMMVNGATIPGTNIWTEQITVQPHTYYAFSTWVCTLAGTASQVALLQFSINGIQIGEVFSAPPYTNQWLQFYELWYSEENTSATITILNQNTGGSGNDFGLDDVSFCEIVVIGEPECTVTVGTMSANNDYQQTCFGQSVEVPFLDNDHLLGNCNDFSCQIIQPAAHGSATYANGVMTYTPNAGYSGNDQFVYRIMCGEQSAEATVFMTIASEIRETLTVSVCESLTWHGHTFDHSVDTSWTVSAASSQGCDSVYELHLTVYPAHETTIVEESLCPNQLPYFFYGQAYYNSVDITVTDSDIHGCDSAVRLLLTVSDYYMPPVQVEYKCEPYTWPVNGMTYYESDMYVDTLPSSSGCDGIYRLDLHIQEAPQVQHVFDTACNSFDWYVKGEKVGTYTASCDVLYQIPIFYVPNDSSTMFPCTEDYMLHLVIWNTPNPVIECDNPDIENPHYPITATEFNVNRYTYRASDLLSDFTWIEDQCEWSISKDSWRIVPSDDHRSCTVYAMDWVEDTVWLYFKAVSPCSEEEDPLASYWLKPSFYGIEEQDVQASAVEIIPNPNNGQMELRFRHLTGRLDVKVYDMKGNKVDQFEVNGQPEEQVMPYDMHNLATGVYLFVVTGREGTAAKRVIVER